MKNWQEDIPKIKQGQGKGHQNHHHQPKVQYREVEENKQESISTNKNTLDQGVPHIYEELDLVIRTKEGIFLMNTTTKIYDEQNLKRLSSNSTGFCFSNNKQYLACIDNQHINIYSIPNYEICAQLEQPGGVFLQFSSTDKYLATLSKVDKEHYSLIIWDFLNKEKVAEFTYGKVKKENWPIFHFAPNDQYIFRLSGNKKLEIYSFKTQLELIHSQEYTSIDKISISSLQNRIVFAIFSQEHVQGYDQSEAFIIFLEYTGGKLTEILKKNLKKANEVSAIWSPDGLNCFVWAQSNFDNTGKSYYGEHQLHLFSLINKSYKEVPTYEGPIHDVLWNPNSQDFIVISGFMPAGTVFYDKYLNAKYEFGKHHRNVVKWSKLSRFVLIAGFGNLAGDIEIWDTFLSKKIGTCKANSTAFCSWAPDSRRFVTAVVTPRLRVDNELKIWKHNGALLNRVDFGKTELYEVEWIPNTKPYKDRAASLPPKQDDKINNPDKPKKIFNMPGNISSLSAMIAAEKNSQVTGAKSFSNNDFTLTKVTEPPKKKIPGAIPDEPKKKRVRKKKDNLDKDEEIKEE